jgi:hypothetical protein
VADLARPSRPENDPRAGRPSGRSGPAGCRPARSDQNAHLNQQPRCPGRAGRHATGATSKGDHGSATPDPPGPHRNLRIRTEGRVGRSTGTYDEADVAPPLRASHPKASDHPGIRVHAAPSGLTTAACMRPEPLCSSSWVSITRNSLPRPTGLHARRQNTHAASRRARGEVETVEAAAYFPVFRPTAGSTLPGRARKGCRRVRTWGSPPRSPRVRADALNAPVPPRGASVGLVAHPSTGRCSSSSGTGRSSAWIR